MPIHSFRDLVEHLRRFTRHAYLTLQGNRPGETVCALALGTDDDVIGFGARAITEEQFASLLAEDIRKYPATGMIHRYCREAGLWVSPDEWPDIDYSTRIAEAVRQSDPFESITWYLDFKDEWRASTGCTHAEYRRRAFRAAIDALRSLDSGGLFGTGSARDKIVLFLSITDSDDDYFLQIESSRMLNPRRVARRLLSSIPIWLRYPFLIRYLVRWLRKGPLIHPQTTQ